MAIFSIISLFNSSMNYLLPEKEININNTEIYEQNNRINSNIVDIVTSTATFVIAVPLFIYHRKLIVKE
ncbi:hypothetical protein D3C73_1348420 [compost metagenome]